MKPTFSIPTEAAPGGTTLRVVGDLDGFTWELVASNLRSLRGAACPRVVLDLSSVRGVHPSGYLGLAEEMARYREAKAQFLILPPRSEAPAAS